MRPRIPAWLDDAGLTPAEMRVMVHLCRRADNKSGIAWPSYDSMKAITRMSKSTIRRAIEELKRRELIEAIGKPFAGSCRYKVLPIVPPEGQKEVSNSSTREPIEGAPIVSPENCNSSISLPSIVSPEGQEGNPKKEVQRRKSKAKIPHTPSMEATALASFFKSSLPPDMDIGNKWKTDWPKVFDALIEKGRDPDEIRAIIKWARTDHFWKSNLMSPAKLNKRDPSGVKYYDIFKAKMPTPNSSQKPQATVNTSNRGTTAETAEAI